MVIDTVEDPLEDDLESEAYLNTLMTWVCTLFTFYIGILASLCIVQHYMCPPKRLQLPGNEAYKRVAWLKLLAGSVQLLMYFGFRADLIYPCCDMISVHFNTFLPAVDARLFFVVFSLVTFINRFSQLAFLIKRWQANTSGVWFPSVSELLACQLVIMSVGCLKYFHDKGFTDSVDHCSVLEIVLCNKYSVEEDHNHFHVDFRIILLVRYLTSWHIAVTMLFMIGYFVRMCLPGYDIHFLILNYRRGGELYKERKGTLIYNYILAMLGCLITSMSADEVLFGNFTPSFPKAILFDSMIEPVLTGEYINLLKSENYYNIFHAIFIIGNLRNGRKWNEDVLRPRSDFSNEDYY